MPMETDIFIHFFYYLAERLYITKKQPQVSPRSSLLKIYFSILQNACFADHTGVTS